MKLLLKDLPLKIGKNGLKDTSPIIWLADFKKFIQECKGSQIMSFLLTQKHSLGWIFFASSVVNLLALTPMLYMLQIFDRVFISESVLTLLTISGVIIFFYVITTVGDYIRSGIMVSLGLKMDEELGKKIFQAALREKVNGQASNPFSLSDDFALVKQWIAGPAVFSLFDIPWIPFYVVLMFVMHPILGYVSLGLILIFTLIGAFAARYLGNQEDYIRKEEQETNSFIYDRLKNEDIIDVHGLAKQFKLIWLKNKKIFYLNLHNKEKKAGKFYHFIKQFQTFSSSLALCVAAVLVMLNELTMATMIAASMLMMRVLSPVTSVVSALSKLSIVTEAISRIEKAIKELNPSNKKKIDYLVGASSEKENSNKILLKIDGVSFQYKNSEKSILNNISFSIGLGESFAVVGKTGAGKSTLGKILAGLYEDYQGTITVNDKGLRNIPYSEFEKLIGYLPQEVMLFTGSISDNITGFKRPDPNVIIKVTKTVGIHEFILKQSSGYDTKLYGGTAGLSGGERQRIGLARAIYNHPRLVILDEPNSALDDSGEAALKHVIKYLKQMNISLLIITHKRSILEVVDKVITMENGEIKTILDSPVFIDEELKTIKLREGKD